MWVLRKKYECLTAAEKSALTALYEYFPSLNKAHSYALKLTHIFLIRIAIEILGLAKLDRWVTSVQKSDLKCFDKFIGTLQKYKPYGANYFKKHQNGFVEEIR